MTQPGTIAVSTLGCRLNQVESQEILALFEGRGFRPASANERPQVHVVNTCTVTGRADFSDRQAIRRIARDNPGALLVVTGCYAQTDAEAVARRNPNEPASVAAEKDDASPGSPEWNLT